ncbi:MAG: protein kinase [Pseudomonadota bacterium]
MESNIGRFQIQRKLGEGSQGTVYLALDPDLQRPVAIKLLDKTTLGVEVEEAFYREARIISRIQHPNLVSIYEAGKHAGTPYLVFEYVEGQLLDDLVKQGELDIGRSLGVFVGVLEGMTQAHQSGVVHRDLKPANIIVNKDWEPKVMDFGVARRVTGHREWDEELMGSPRYMAPEYIREGQISPRADVFALGLILAEMLTGLPVFQARRQNEVLRAIVEDPVPPPSHSNPKVDKRLDQIVLKAVEKDPDQRFANAGEMLTLVNGYRDSLADTGGTKDNRSTVDFLIRRMSHKGDFPALSTSIQSLNAIANTEDRSVSEISRVIIKDFALTNKILKVVNSSYYANFAGTVSTVSRAALVLGMGTLRQLSSSLIFFEHLHNKGQADKIKSQVSAALFSGVVAARLPQRLNRESGEEYFLTAMMQNLGKLLVNYYLPEEAEEIDRLAGQNTAATKAQRNVLGATFQEIGQGIAQAWNFPVSLSVTMRDLPEGDLKPSRNDTENRFMTAGLANEIAQTTLSGELSNESRIHLLSNRFHDALGVDFNRLQSVIQVATRDFQAMYRDLATPGPPNSFVRALLGRDSTKLAAAPGAIGNPSITAPITTAATIPTSEAEALLTDGLQEISNILLKNGKIDEVFNVVLEVIYRSMSLQRVLLCLKDAIGQNFVARVSIGHNADDFSRRFRFPMAFEKNVFHAALRNNVDIYISDAQDSKIAVDIPNWYKRISDARSFLLFPLSVGGKPVGLLYGDHPLPSGIDVTTKKLNLLKTLRNQLMLACRTKR